MAQIIRAYQGGYGNVDLRNSQLLDVSSASVTQWSGQGFTVEQTYQGHALRLVFTGSFSANGTPAKMSDVLGHADSAAVYLNGALLSGQQWQPGYDLQHFNPPVNLAYDYAYLDSGLLFVGSATAPGSDAIQGGDSNDVFAGYGGIDIFYGAGGLDHAVFRGSLNDYTFNTTVLIDRRIDDNNPNMGSVNGVVVTDLVSNRDSVTNLVEIERLQFNDINLALDTDGVAGQAYRLYKAAFNRQPDEGGLGYWIDQLDKGTGLRDVSYGFLASAEFISLYGNNVSNQEFINALYLNVLQRGADQSGFDYWENVLAQGYSRENILLDFSDSLENRVNVETLIANGIRYESWDPIVL